MSQDNPNNESEPQQDAPEETAPNSTDSGVASPEQNSQLEHTQGGVTTRDDATDLGVPMKPGSGSEPVGPEDALGEGPKRGDYSDRIGPSNYQPHESKPIPDAKPGERNTTVEAQRPRVEDVGDVEGKKGGVETSGQDA